MSAPYITINKTQQIDNQITSFYSDVVMTAGLNTVSHQVVVDVDTPAAATSPAGRVDTTTFTFPAKAAATAGDYFVVYDQAGTAWAGALDVTGSDPEPTGAIWTAIPAGNKVNIDISSGTDGASVAALVETAMDALTGFSAVITSTTTTDSIAMINVVRGLCSAGVVSNEDDSGVGSITVVETTAGIDSGTNTSTDTFTSAAAHDFTTGLKLQASSSGTLPAGITTATDYYVIVVSATEFQLALSLADALAGTEIDITDQGTSAATHTFTPTSIGGGTCKIQYTNNPSSSASWVDGPAANAIQQAALAGTPIAITADAAFAFRDLHSAFQYARLSFAITAGRMSVTVYTYGDNT